LTYCSNNNRSQLLFVLNQPDMEPPIPVRDSVKQIDANSWLVGSKHVLHHVQGPREGDCLWESPSDGSYYTLSAAPVPRGDGLIIKIRIATENTRREPETLAFLAKQQLSFDIPAVLFYMEDVGKTYLVEPYIPGK
jgi:hypothetical protein